MSKDDASVTVSQSLYIDRQDQNYPPGRLLLQSSSSKDIMKFGQQLPRNQVPEWASAYIDYKGLKKLIKGAKQNLENGGDADLVGMYIILSLIHI